MLEGQSIGNEFSTVAEKRLSHRSWWGTTSSHNATVHLCVTLALHTDRRGTSLKGWWFITYVLCFIVTEQAVLESEVRVQRKDRKLLTKSRFVFWAPEGQSLAACPCTAYVTASQNTTYGWDSRKHILHLPLPPPIHLPFHPSLNNSTRTELQTKIND